MDRITAFAGGVYRDDGGVWRPCDIDQSVAMFIR